MKRLIKLFAVASFCFSALMASIPIAYAGCMDSADDVLFGFLSGGMSVAACQLKELVDAIQNFIKTVGDLANNVASDAKAVADAAVGTVKSAANDITNTVIGAQKDLGNAVSEAKAMTSPIAISPSANAPKINAQGTIQSAAKTKTGPNAAVMTAPILNQADPQQLHSALERGAQQLGTLKTSVDQEIAGRINSAIQQAGNQATSHLADAADIVKTALLAPINALLKMLNDLVNHPTTLLDPIATINTMVDDISNNITTTLNHINDDITKDAIATLNSVEMNVQQVQGSAQTGDKLLKAMRVAHQERTKAALNALESQLNAIQGSTARSRALAMPAQAVFRFAPVQNKMHAALQQKVMPFQSVSSNLKNNWAKIKTLHMAAQPRPLDLHTKQTARNHLDQLFRGKSAADVESIKQNLLSSARMKFGSNAKLMASIEQNLNGYIRDHVAPVAPLSAPGSKLMLNPQPLPPKQGAGTLPTMQR